MRTSCFAVQRSILRLAAVTALVLGPLSAIAQVGEGDGVGGVGPDTSLKDFDEDILDDARDQLRAELGLKCGGVDRVARCEALGGKIHIEGGDLCTAALNSSKLKAATSFQYASTLSGSKKVGGKTPIKIAGGSKTTELATANEHDSDKKLKSPTPIKDPIKKPGGGTGGIKQLDTIKGGVLGKAGCVCTCIVFDQVGAQVTNAAKGDAALVPLHDGGGDDIVRVIMGALGQRHRHVVMFSDAGKHVRHTTAENDLQPEDLENGKTRIKPALLRNAMPGMLTNSVGEALITQRLGYQGLILKPAYEFFRPYFEDAADIADETDGYYKISDYSDLEGMTKTYAEFGTSAYDDQSLRGTMCSGFVHHAFTEAGTVISLRTYSADLRDEIAVVLFDTVKATILGSTNWFKKIISYVFVGTAKKVANQVTNCFAGLGCADNKDTWKSGVGAGTTVSPDNLMPTNFTLGGAGTAPWGAGTTLAGATLTNEHGAAMTPFQRVEPMVLAASYWKKTVLTTW
ncbi:MAG: hypothetical protein KC502_17340 [Myxococcales bacterium]|nr:hypothetical protein [Myxococcales bacterium]